MQNFILKIWSKLQLLVNEMNLKIISNKKSSLILLREDFLLF